ncbi:MAG: hypothetical protein KAR79_00990 [Simkaniaceae bacterium]|nr:hypothetical protein [Simkaniaceae bacterium]
MKSRFFFCIFFSLFSQVFSLTLKDKLQNALPGDYIVTQQNSVYSLLTIHKIQATTVILEEISIPAHKVSASKMHWKNWVENKAPGHSSWIMYEIDLKKGLCLESYSFSRNAFLAQGGSDNFIVTLLELPLILLEESLQKKIGPSPPFGEPDLRKTWKPKQYIEGIKCKTTQFNAYRTVWPKDRTELSQKQVDLYFDALNPDFPFPYWMQITDGSLSFKMHAVDSGRGLTSPQKHFPKKAPEFVGNAKKIDGAYRLTLKISPSFGTFKLYALDVNASKRQSIQIPFDINYHQESSLAHIDIQEENLNHLLQKEHDYIFVAISQEEPDLYAETNATFALINK